MKWLLAIPHYLDYLVLIFLYIAAVVVAIIAWLTVPVSGRYKPPTARSPALGPR